MKPSRSQMLMLAGVLAALLLGAGALRLVNQPSAPPKPVAAAVPAKPDSRSLRPSLDCSFNAFMHNSATVYFYFDVVVRTGAPPHFYQRALVAADGTRQRFEGDDRPAWGYAVDADGLPTITSGDGATRIVLYGLKLGTPGVLLVEAGLRSNVLRNLGGQCRQTNLVETAS